MSADAKPLAVYAAIYKDLRSRIWSGKLHPGDMLPSENQLCSEYSASRETVRKGLKQLDREGLIYSRPKVGYFVSVPNHSNLTLTMNDDPADFTTQYRDVHGIAPDETLQHLLEVEPQQLVIELTQVTRNLSGEAVSCDIKYIPYERAYPSVESEMRYAVLPDIALEKTATFEYYTEISVSAVGASERVASILDCAPGTPLLLIERIFLRQNGKKVGYSQHFRMSQYSKLKGTSGHHP